MMKNLKKHLTLLFCCLITNFTTHLNLWGINVLGLSTLSVLVMEKLNFSVCLFFILGTFIFHTSLTLIC